MIVLQCQFVEQHPGSLSRAVSSVELLGGRGGYEFGRCPNGARVARPVVQSANRLDCWTIQEKEE